MDSYRVSTVDVPESPTASGAGQEVRDSSGVIPCIAMKNDGVCTTKCRHMLHTVPENILVFYDFVPLQFWSKNVALGL